MRTNKRWLTVGAVLVVLLAVAVIPASADRANTWYVDLVNGNDAYSCTAAWAACQTIGAAYGKAAAGDTIQVASGTALVPYVYNEDLAINMANLTIVSSGGAASTVINGTAGAPATVDAQALSSGLTFGKPDQGFTLRDTGGSKGLFQLTGGPDNITIDSNIFDRTVSSGVGNSSGVLVGIEGPASAIVVDGLSVINNRFDQALTAYVGIDLWSAVTNLLVDGNDFNGAVGTNTGLSAVTSEGVTVDGAVISNNTIDSESISLGLGGDTKYIDDVTISGNTFSNIIHWEGGIVLVEGGGSEPEGVLQRVSNIDITGNTFNPSIHDSFAFLIEGAQWNNIDDTDIDYSTLHFNYNNVLDPGPTGNTHRIVTNTPVDAGALGIPDLDAECNWWGTRDGPLHVSNTYTDPVDPAAFVDVSNDVDFTPWLDAAYPDGSCWVPGVLNLALGASASQVAAGGVDSTTIGATLTDPSGNPARDGTLVDFTTTLGFFTTAHERAVKNNVPTVDGVASVKLYSDVAGYANVDATFGPYSVEKRHLVAFTPVKPLISYPAHKSRIRDRDPMLSWTASPAAAGVQVLYQVKLVRLRPRPRKVVLRAWTDKASIQSPYLDGRRYLLKVRSCLGRNRKLCSRWTKSRFRVRGPR